MFGAPVFHVLLQLEERLDQFGAISRIDAGVFVESVRLDILAWFRCCDFSRGLGFLGRTRFYRGRLHLCSLGEREVFNGRS